jgi:endonuclease III
MTESKKAVAEKVLEKYGRTFSDQLGIYIEENTPSPLFRLLVFAILSSTRIRYEAAVEAAEALSKEGWNTPEKMAEATWRQRTDVLNESGYARYDESTSRMLEDTANILLEEYKGDLRNLREEAGRDPAQERKLLKKFKGLGDVGVDIFFREAQTAWDELMPFADDRALKAAKKLGLGDSISDLKNRVDKKDFTRFIAGLVRIELEDAYGEIEK